MPQAPRFVERVQSRQKRGRAAHAAKRFKSHFLPFGRVRRMAAFLTTLDFFDEPRGLRHVKLTFYAHKLHQLRAA